MYLGDWTVEMKADSSETLMVELKVWKKADPKVDLKVSLMESKLVEWKGMRLAELLVG